MATPPLASFIKTYQQYSAGLDHELVLIFKGFHGTTQTPYQDLLSDMHYKSVFVSDHGFDINAYYKAALQVDCEYVCFLNSYTRVQCSNWLAYFFEHVCYPGVGAAGATGSWESMYQNLLLQKQRGLWRKPSSKWTWPLKAMVLACIFPQFPNPHLRTTGFICPRRIFLETKPPKPWAKLNAIAFESGRWSFSKQLRHRGLEIVVVNRDNNSFGWKNWPQSRTFRTGQQEKLLLADNRTQQYAEACLEERCWLGRMAWGSSWSGECGDDGFPNVPNVRERA